MENDEHFSWNFFYFNAYLGGLLCKKTSFVTQIRALVHLRIYSSHFGGIRYCFAEKKATFIFT